MFLSALTSIGLISSKNHAILTKHALEIRSDALIEETKFNKTYFYWPGIVGAISRPGFAAVYVAQHHACVIPNRFFSSQAERTSFLALVRDKIQTASNRGDAAVKFNYSFSFTQPAPAKPELAEYGGSGCGTVQFHHVELLSQTALTGEISIGQPWIIANPLQNWQKNSSSNVARMRGEELDASGLWAGPNNARDRTASAHS